MSCRYRIQVAYAWGGDEGTMLFDNIQTKFLYVLTVLTMSKTNDSAAVKCNRDVLIEVVSAIGSEKKQKAASSQMAEQQEQQAAKVDVPISKASMDLGGSIVPSADVGAIGERSKKPDQASWKPPSDVGVIYVH